MKAARDACDVEREAENQERLGAGAGQHAPGDSGADQATDGQREQGQRRLGGAVAEHLLQGERQEEGHADPARV